MAGVIDVEELQTGLDFEILKKQLNELISYYVDCGDVNNTTNEDILREFKAWVEKQIWMIRNSL